MSRPVSASPATGHRREAAEDYPLAVERHIAGGSHAGIPHEFPHAGVAGSLVGLFDPREHRGLIVLGLHGAAEVVGHYWVQSTTSGHSITSLDINDSSHPVDAGHLALKGDALPH